MVIIIKPISAQLTKDKDLFGKSDPYCVITIGSEKQKTKPHSGGGKSPQWMDTLQFQSQNSIMKVAVLDKDTFSDDMIGQGTVNLDQLYSNPNRTENEYVDLVHRGKSTGRLLLSMEYQGPPMGGNQGGWGGNQGGWGNQGGNQGGWGNQGGNQGGWGNQGGNQGGWGGNQGGNQGWGGNQGGNQGWGGNQGGNQGWGGNQGGNQGGWGNGPNQGGGWGNGPNNGPNNGWGNNGPNNGGWGGNQGGNNGW